MLLQYLREYRARLRLLRANSGLFIGKRTVVEDSNFSNFNRIGNDSVVLNSNFGNFTYAGPRCTIVRSNIGHFTSIAPDVMIGTGGHPVRGAASLHPIFYLSRHDLGWDLVNQDKIQEFTPTRVGNDVWIGTKVVIRDGITVGDGAVVGAGAVVVTDLEPYGIYGGVPARLIRFRFSSHVVERLRALAWWDRDPDWLRSNADLFEDVDQLLAAEYEQ